MKSFKRYEKEYLDIEYRRFAAAIDVKFLDFKNIHENTIKRYQYIVPRRQLLMMLHVPEL